MKTTLFVAMVALLSSPSFSDDLNATQAPDASSIVGFAQVTPGIFRGGRPEEAGMKFLASIGVRTDISLQGGDLDAKFLGKVIPWFEPGETPEEIAQESAQAAALKIGFFHAPLNSLDEITDAESALIDQTLERMADPTAQPVFIHCEHGKDRTGLLVALYRVKYQKWSVSQAFDEWKSMGHDTLHRMFTGDLDTYFFKKTNASRN